MRCRPWHLIPLALLSLIVLKQNFNAAEHWSIGGEKLLEVQERLQKLEAQSKDIADLHQDIEELRRALSSRQQQGESTREPRMEVEMEDVQPEHVVSTPAVKSDDLCNIFAMWNYPHGTPLFIKKNLESWIHYSKGRCHFPYLINDTNIRDFVPDLPAEYDRIVDYDAARSDVIRYALLHHHGGIYLDTDFLVVKDLAPILDRINDHDLISYTTAGQSCQRGTFSSNFIAGRKGSKVFGAVWEAQKAALADHCDDRLKVNEKKVCCSDDLQRRCHIPWAGIGEGISHPVVQKLMKEVRAQKAKVRTFCFEGDDSFVPNYFLEILEKTPNLQDAETAFKRQGVRKASKRIMYHLFASLGFGSNHDGANLFDASTFIGHLYRKSLGSFTEIPRDPLEDGPGVICAEDGEICKCNGKVFYGRRWEDKDQHVKAELKSLVKKGYAFRENVTGEVKCSVDVFGDPLFTIPKHCVCQVKLGS